MGVRTSCSVCLLLTNTLAAVYRSSYLFYGPQFMSREHEDLKGGVVDILRPNQVLNTEQYNVNQQKISQLRELASKMEQTNEEAHRRFIEQDLRRRVEEGERARQMLENLSRPNTQPSIPPNSAPQSPVNYQGHDGQVNSAHIIPTTARIEEVHNLSPQHSQNVGSSSTRSLPAQSNASRLNPNMQSHNDLQFNNMPGQSQPPSQYYRVNSHQRVQRAYETYHGRWQTQQLKMQAQPHLQQQQQPYPELARSQEAQYTRVPATSYANRSLPQSNISGHVYPSSGPSQQQNATVPVVTTSFSLAGALGQPDPTQRASSSSSRKVIPTTTAQRTRTTPNQNGAAQGQPSNAQGNRSKSKSKNKDMIVTEMSERTKLDAISGVAPSASNSVRAAPTPVTRDSKPTATSHMPSGQANITRPQHVQPVDKSAPINPHPQAQTSANQVRLDFRVTSEKVWSTPPIPIAIPSASLKSNSSSKGARQQNRSASSADQILPGPQTSQSLGQQASFFKSSTPISSSLSNLFTQGSSAQAPSTPSNKQIQPSGTLRTPASADKKHIARDILRSLGSSQVLNGKRKRSHEPPTSIPNKRGQKRQGGGTPDTQFGTVSTLQFGQHSHAVDVVPVIAAAPEMDGDDDDEAEINLVEDMTSLSPPPSLSINDNTKDTMSTKSIAIPQFSPIPKLEAERSKAKEPLFLPSSRSSSPNRGRAPSFQDQDGDGPGVDNMDTDTAWDMDLTLMKDLNASVETPAALEPKKKSKRMEVFVLVPPPPDWVKQAKLNTHGTQASKESSKRKGLSRGKKGNVDEAEDEIEEWTELSMMKDEEKRRQDEAVERSARSLTSSLMRQQPCKWRNCNAVMNSVDNLSRHLAQHVGDKPVSGSFVCLWQNCLRRFLQEGKLLVHVESHARMPVPCPFQGCDDDYRTPKDLISHCFLEHKNDSYRPTTMLSKPRPVTLPEVPLTLPSYMVIPRDIRQKPISKDRHTLIGPWVLRNIFGPVNLEVKRQNAAVPLRSIRGAIDGEDSVTATPPSVGYDEYDFLKPISPPSSKVPYFDDLPSEAVSQLIHAGLVFWGPKIDDAKETEFIGFSPDSIIQDDPGVGRDGSSPHDVESLTERQKSFPPLSNFQADATLDIVQGQHDVGLDDNLLIFH